MLEITEVLGNFVGTARDEYIAQHPYPVMMHQTNRGHQEDTGGFSKGLGHSGRGERTIMSARSEFERETSRSATGLLVFPVINREGSGYDNVIMVGRGQISDIELPYHKVSKLHAYFTWSTEKDRWFLSDANATNGTFVNGVRLQPETPVELRTGTALKFGTAEMTFYSAPDFYDYLADLQKRLQAAT